MSDPAETPAEAIERLNKEIAELRRLRAQLPVMILTPYVEDALGHIKEVAARLTVKAEIPASEAIQALRAEETEATTPETPPSPPETLLAPGTLVTTADQKIKGMVLRQSFAGTLSPPRWETVILTEDGRILTVPPESVVPVTGSAPAASATTEKPRPSPGSRVKDRTTGKTGYVSEVADDKATVALDEGGFVVRALADLETI